MNIRSRVVCVIGMCVAVPLTITSCSVATVDASDSQRESHSIKDHNPLGYDYWLEVDSGEPVEKSGPIAEVFDLVTIHKPHEYLAEQGALGVAKLQEYCVVAFGETVPVSDDMLDVIVFSRFNDYYELIMTDVELDTVALVLNDIRPLCSGEVELHDVLDGPSDDQAVA